MNDIERIEKTLHDVIDYLVLTSGEVDKIGALKDIRRNLIDEPTHPLGYQALNKWYWCNDVVFYVLKQNGKDLFGYGYVKHVNKWNYEDAHMHHLLKDDNIRPATESEIKEAILKGCEQNGIVEGATVKIDDSFLKFEIENFNDVYYHVKHNRLFINDIKVFDNGKFAEVVKEEKEKYRLGRKQQRAILETQTGKEYLLFPQGHEDTARCFLRYLNGGDLSKNELIKIIGSLNKPSVNMIDCDEAKKLKELLKECALIIKSSMDNYVSYSSRILMENLLTKLNKHLNHE